jgi:integrase
MASLWKDDRTENRVACITLIVRGQRVQVKRSTGARDRLLAERIANALEDAGQGRMPVAKVREFLDGLSDLRVRRVAEKSFDSVLRLATGLGLQEQQGPTARAFVEGWLRRTAGEVSAATRVKYEQTGRMFLECLGPLADDRMDRITEGHIVRFRDAQAERVSPVSANLYYKIVRSILAAAEAAGALTKNPARHVKVLKTSRESARRAFTLPELNRLLAVADDEWRSMILFGFYTGARLGDIAAARWQQIDLQTGTFTYTARKTGRTTIIPLPRVLLAHVEKMPAGDDPAQPLHPRTFKAWNLRQQSNSLSRSFGELLATAGLVAERPRQKKKDGKGRAARRDGGGLTFHCLRHTAVSLLKNAGVSDAVARDIAGHESPEVARLYTHIEDSTKREALDLLPDLTKAAAAEPARTQREGK